MLSLPNVFPIGIIRHTEIVENPIKDYHNQGEQKHRRNCEPLDYFFEPLHICKVICFDLVDDRKKIIFVSYMIDF